MLRQPPLRVQRRLRHRPPPSAAAAAKPASAPPAVVASSTPATPTSDPKPASKAEGGEYYWGYASGVVATKVEDWGEFVQHTSLYQEELPDGPLPDNLELFPSPSALNGADLTAQALPEAWQGTEATLQNIVDVLAKHRGYSVPWAMVSRAVDEALSLKLLQRADTSMPWPCSPVAADQVLLRIPEEIELSPEAIVQALKYTGTGEPTLRAV